MAEFDFDFPEDLLKQIVRMEENTDNLQFKMLKAAAPILEERMVKGIRQVGANDTGELIKSIKMRRPHKDKKGIWQVFIGPSGYAEGKTFKSPSGRTYPLTNAAKLIFIEYGTVHQSAKPFLKRITRTSEQSVIQKMQEIYNKEADK